MDSTKIPEYGEIDFEMTKDLGKYTETIRGFLRNLIEGIAQRSAEYYRNTGGRDHLFADREKQFNTAVCPVVANIGPSCVFKMELPIKREGKPRRGNLDYWILYNDVVLALELKLAHISYSGDYLKKKSIHEKYNEALKQLENIEKDDVPYLLKKSDKLVKIALEAIVFQKESKDKIKLKENEVQEIQQDIRDKINHLIKSGKFNKEINFNAIWLLEEDLVPLEPVIYDKYRVLPALGLIGHISDLKTRRSD